MHIYTKCRFCFSELTTPQNHRKAFCDTHCKEMGKKWGTVHNMKGNRIATPTLSRKTTRKQSTRKERQPNGTYATVVSVAHNGIKYTQLPLVLDYPETVPPLCLTGGAIIEQEQENEESD